MSVTEEELAALVGRSLPGGSFRVEGYEDWLLRDVLGRGDQPAGSLHPLWAMAGLQRDMGLDLEELFELCGSSSDDGPMLGGMDLELAAPLQPGSTYPVTASIVGADRKSGRRAGVFDLVTVEIHAHDGDGDVVASTRITYVFPRR